MFDADKNGTISKQELRAVFETGEAQDEQLWTDIFKEVDTDGDGTITFEEFKKAMDSVAKSESHLKYLVKSEVKTTE